MVVAVLKAVIKFGNKVFAFFSGRGNMIFFIGDLGRFELSYLKTFSEDL